MKLLLLLVAIYSLIFYQQYKIEKAGGLPPGTRINIKTSQFSQYPDTRRPQDFGNAVLLLRNHYPGYIYSNKPDRRYYMLAAYQ
jgi:hypothetical protein